MSKITEASYSFVERPSSLLYAVKINAGKYEGVIVTYGKVSLKEENGLLRLNFQYKIEESANHNIKTLEHADAFRNTLGDILSHIIESSIQKGTAKIGDKADKMTLLAKNVIESTANNPSESGQQREVLPEGPSVHQD